MDSFKITLLREVRQAVPKQILQISESVRDIHRQILDTNSCIDVGTRHKLVQQSQEKIDFIAVLFSNL